MATICDVRERPILLSGPMVRAIRKGVKTQTRRVVNPRGMNFSHSNDTVWHDPDEGIVYVRDDGGVVDFPCPHGKRGDRLWVRETWSGDDVCGVVYRADHPCVDLSKGDLDDGEQQIRSWKPSIFMPRWACRTVLEITEVRVQRIQDIGDEDILAEGVLEYGESLGLRYGPRALWVHLWEAINGKRDGGRYAWGRNPWTWAITFRLPAARGGLP